jgi:hypothetical protein
MKYIPLKIVAKDANTEIWVGDSHGHLVQKEVGLMDTRLLPGHYTVSFGLHGPRRRFRLRDKTEIFEGSDGKSC